MIDGSYEVPGRPIALTPARRLVAAGIEHPGQPWQTEPPQQSAADIAAHTAASHVRQQEAITHSLQAATLADEAGWTDAADGFRADAARMQKAMAS